MAECRYKGQCRIEYDTDFDVCYPCIGDWGDTCARYEPMPDVDALLALADGLCDGYPYGLSHGGLEQLARHIREALGVES